MTMMSHHPKRHLGMVLSILFIAVLAACTPSHAQSTFDTVGPVARSQLVLFYWIFWAAVFVFVTVVGAMLYIVIRYRRKPGDADPEQVHGHKTLEIAWTVLPAVILAVVAVPTIDTIFDNATSPEPGALTVEVVAHQWWWEFKYPNPDGSGDVVVTANELHMPVSEVVNVTLESLDVLHSFWIPKIAGKVDLVPNNINTMWLQADTPGEYLGQCAEFCGVAHAHMRFRVIVQPRAEFDAWLAAQTLPAVESPDPLALEGKALFEDQAGCFSCHTVSGVRKARGTIGPNLTHVASRGRIAAGELENTQANLKRWLEDPDDVKPGNIMARDALVYKDADGEYSPLPSEKLSGAQIDALVAYLRTLK
jgi:cytochrome c oxidase subunit 2